MTGIKDMGIQELAAAAVQVQNASNLAGVLRSFVEVVDRLRVLAPPGHVNTHPIVQAFADKVASLAGVQGMTGEACASVAHRAVERIASRQQGRDVPVAIDADGSVIWRAGDGSGDYNSGEPPTPDEAKEIAGKEVG